MEPDAAQPARVTPAYTKVPRGRVSDLRAQASKISRALHTRYTAARVFYFCGSNVARLLLTEYDHDRYCSIKIEGVPTIQWRHQRTTKRGVCCVSPATASNYSWGGSPTEVPTITGHTTSALPLPKTTAVQPHATRDNLKETRSMMTSERSRGGGGGGSGNGWLWGVLS